jgi:endonuclease YncB( thermonuclease family)
MYTSFIVLSSCADLSILEDDIEFAYQTWCDNPLTVSVSRVYDGDTFDFVNDLTEERIRMLGVAAPEVESNSDSAECYGPEAAEFLTDIIEGEEVRLDFDTECTDIYDRTLAWVSLSGDDPEISSWMEIFELDGLNEDGSYEVLVNELLVRMGYATVFDGELDQSIRFEDRMSDAEDAAEAELRGLWNECD